jgi:hypothetical protein
MRKMSTNIWKLAFFSSVSTIERTEEIDSSARRTKAQYMAVRKRAAFGLSPLLLTSVIFLSLKDQKEGPFAHRVSTKKDSKSWKIKSRDKKGERAWNTYRRYIGGEEDEREKEKEVSHFSRLV